MSYVTVTNDGNNKGTYPPQYPTVEVCESCMECYLPHDYFQMMEFGGEFFRILKICNEHGPF